MIASFADRLRCAPEQLSLTELRAKVMQMDTVTFNARVKVHLLANTRLHVLFEMAEVQQSRSNAVQQEWHMHESARQNGATFVYFGGKGQHEQHRGDV